MPLAYLKLLGPAWSPPHATPDPALRRIDMAVIKRSLGNRQDIIIKRFRKIYSDGIGGFRFRIFCEGWKAAFKEMNEQALKEAKDD